MAATVNLENRSAHEGSGAFRPLFLQRVCRSASTVRDKIGFTYLQLTVAGKKNCYEIYRGVIV